MFRAGRAEMIARSTSPARSERPKVRRRSPRWDREARQLARERIDAGQLSGQGPQPLRGREIDSVGLGTEDHGSGSGSERLIQARRPRLPPAALWAGRSRLVRTKSEDVANGSALAKASLTSATWSMRRSRSRWIGYARSS